MKFSSFMKLFGIIFASMLGVFGITFGIMKLTGYFDVTPVYPERIYFASADGNESGQFFFDEDSTIYIKATNEDCNQLNVELSLAGEKITESADGKITDGVIVIPKYARIGSEIKVELKKSNEIVPSGEDWIVGGVSGITAKSTDTNLVSSVTCKVNVDTPVYSIDVYTKDSENSSSLATIEAFNKGSNVYADIKFVPENSRYFYSQQNITKNMYFALDKAYSAIAQDGITNKFQTLEVADSVKIIGYVFKKASLQENVVSEVTSELGANASAETIFNEVLTKINNQNMVQLGTALKKDVEFAITETEVSGITFGDQAKINDMYINKLHTIYFGDVRNLFANQSSLKAMLTSSKTDLAVSLQDKIGYIGVAIEVRVGSEWVDAVDNGYFIVDGLNETAYSTVQTFDGKKYYFPVVNDKDFNSSFIKVVPSKEASQVRLQVNYFEDDEKLLDENLSLNVFSISDLKSDTVTWQNAQDNIKLVVIDGKNDNFETTRYNLSNNIVIPATNQYKTTKYFAFDFKKSETEALEADLITEIVNVKEGQTYTLRGSNYVLYEIDDPQGNIYAKTNKNLPVTFKVLFMTIKTDYAGNLKTVGGVYDYDQYSATSSLGILSALNFEITKTLKDDVATSIEISDTADKTLLIKDEISGEYKKIEAGETPQKVAVKANQQNVITLNVSILKSDADIFVQEIRDGKISIVAQNDGAELSIISYTDLYSQIIGQTPAEDGERLNYQIKLSVLDLQSGLDYPSVEIGIKYNKHPDIGYVYYMNSRISVLGTDIEFTAAEDESKVTFEIYSGKAVNTAFNFNKELYGGNVELAGYVNSEENPIYIKTTLDGDVIKTVYEITFVDAEGNKQTISEEKVKALLFKTGNVLNIISNDKYGNYVQDNTLTVASSNSDAIQVSSGYEITYKNDGLAIISLLDANGNIVKNRDVNNNEYEEKLYIQRETEVTINKVEIKDRAEWNNETVNENEEPIFDENITYNFPKVTVALSGENGNNLNLLANDATDTNFLVRYSFGKIKDGNYDYSSLNSITKISLKNDSLFSKDEQNNYYITDSNNQNKLKVTYDDATKSLSRIDIQGNFANSCRLELLVTIEELGVSQEIDVVVEPVVQFDYSSNQPLGASQYDYSENYAQTTITLDYRIYINSSVVTYSGSEITKNGEDYLLSSDYRLKKQEGSENVWLVYNFVGSNPENSKFAKLKWLENGALESVQILTKDSGTYNISVHLANDFEQKVDNNIVTVTHNQENQIATFVFEDVTEPTQYIILLTKQDGSVYDLSRQFYVKVMPNAKITFANSRVITSKINTNSQTYITKNDLLQLLTVERISLDKNPIDNLQIRIYDIDGNEIDANAAYIINRQIYNFKELGFVVKYKGYTLNEADEFKVKVLSPITAQENTKNLSYRAEDTKAKIVNYGGEEAVLIYNGLSYGENVNTPEQFIQKIGYELFGNTNIEFGSLNKSGAFVEDLTLISTWFIGENNAKAFSWANRPNSVGEYAVKITDAAGGYRIVPVIISPFKFNFAKFDTDNTDTEELQILQDLYKDYKYANDIETLLTNGIYAYKLLSTNGWIALEDAFANQDLQDFMKAYSADNVSSFKITNYLLNGKQTHIQFATLSYSNGWIITPNQIGQTGYTVIEYIISAGANSQSIPIIIKVESTLDFKAYYPYADGASENSQDADMAKDFELFAEDEFDMEYLYLKNRKATVDLLSNDSDVPNNGFGRFIIYKDKNDSTENTADNTNKLSSNFNFEVAEIYYKSNSTLGWNKTQDLSIAKIAKYSNKAELRIDLSQTDYTQVRIKIKVTSSQYSELFYYVCATSENPLILQELKSGIYTDNVSSSRTVTAGTDVAKDGENNLYRLLGKSAEGLLTNEYPNKLKYMFTNKDVISADGETTLADLTTNQVSNLVIYTKYGPLKTIYLNILSNYYLYDVQEEKMLTEVPEYSLSSGQSIPVERLLGLKKNDDQTYLALSQITVPEGAFKVNGIDYSSFITIDGTTLKIAPFTEDVIFNITGVKGTFGTIEDYAFNIVLTITKSVEVGEVAGSKISRNNLYAYENTENKTTNFVGTFCATSEEQNLLNIKENLFNFNSANIAVGTVGNYNIVFEVADGNVAVDETYFENNSLVLKDGKIKFNRVIATTNVVIIARMMSDVGTSAEEILCSYLVIKVAPVYYVQINYPTVNDDQSMDYEQVQEDVGIDLSSSNTFLGQANNRVTFIATSDGTPTALTKDNLKVNIPEKFASSIQENDIEIDGTTVKAKLSGSAISGRFNIDIVDGGITYGSYTIEIIDSSPYAVSYNNIGEESLYKNSENTPEVIYVNGNDTNLMNQIKVKYQIPSVASDDSTQKYTYVLTLGESEKQTGKFDYANVITLVEKSDLTCLQPTNYSEIITISGTRTALTNNIYWYLLDSDGNIVADKSGSYAAKDVVSSRISIVYIDQELQFSNIYNYIVANTDITNGYSIEAAIKKVIQERNKALTSDDKTLEEIDKSLELTPGNDKTGLPSYFVKYVFNIDFASDNVVSKIDNVSANILDDSLDFGGKTYQRESIYASTDKHNLATKMGKTLLNDAFAFAGYGTVKITLVGTNTAQYVTVDLDNGANFDENAFIVHGAPNNGANVNIVVEFSKTFGDVTYLKKYVYLLKAMPSIEASCTNGETIQNSIISPYEVNFGLQDEKQITLATESSVVNGENNLVVMTHTYSTKEINIAYSSNIYAQTNAEFITKITKANGLVNITFKKPTFGNKLIEIIVSDSYGYIVTYYIKLLVSETGEDPTYNYSTTRDYYEGDSNKVVFRINYNMVLVQDGDIVIDGLTSEGGLNINSITFKEYIFSSRTYTGIETEIFDSKKILPQFSILNNISDNAFTSGSYVQGRFEVELEKNSEKTTIYIPVRLNKRYIIEQSSEEKYVRDGVAFRASDGIAVVDNKNSSKVLGSRVLEDKYVLDLNLSYITNKLKGIDYDTSKKYSSFVSFSEKNSDNKVSPVALTIYVEAKQGNVEYNHPITIDLAENGSNYTTQLTIGANGILTQIDNPAAFTYNLFVYAPDGRTKVYLAFAADDIAKALYGNNPFIALGGKVYENGATVGEESQYKPYGEIFTGNQSRVKETQDLTIYGVANETVDVAFDVGGVVKVVTGVSLDTAVCLNDKNGILDEIEDNNSMYRAIQTKAKLFYGKFNNVDYVNGLSLDADKTAKGIDTIELADKTGFKDSQNNTQDDADQQENDLFTGGLTTLNLKIGNGWVKADGDLAGYQSKQVKYEVKLESGKSSTITVNYKITTKYSDVDTQEARGTNASIVIVDSVNKGKTGYNLTIDENGNITDNSSIAANIWAKDIKLTAGNGIANQIMQNTAGENRLFVNDGKTVTLQKNLKVEVVTLEGENSGVQIDGNGKITFTQNKFNINQNHVRLQVYVANMALGSVNEDGEAVAAYEPIGEEIVLTFATNSVLTSVLYKNSFISSHKLIYLEQNADNTYKLSDDEINNVLKFNNSDDYKLSNFKKTDIMQIWVDNEQPSESFDISKISFKNSTNKNISLRFKTQNSVSYSLVFDFVVVTSKIYSIQAKDFAGESFEISKYTNFTTIYGESKSFSDNDVNGKEEYSLGEISTGHESVYGIIELTLKNNNIYYGTNVKWYKPFTETINVSASDYARDYVNNESGIKIYSELTLAEKTVQNGADSTRETITTLQSYLTKLGLGNDLLNIKVFKNNDLMEETIDNITLQAKPEFATLNYEICLQTDSSPYGVKQVTTNGVTTNYIVLAKIVINIKRDVTDLNVSDLEEGYSLDLDSISSSDTSENCANIKNNCVVIGGIVYFNLKDDGSSYLNTQNTYTLTFKKDGSADIVKIIKYNSELKMWKVEEQQVGE